MKKLLLITLVAGGLAFASAPRSDAQVYFSVGFGPGYYGYYPYGYYYPYRYYQPYYRGTAIGLIIGPAGIVITVITVTITTIGTRLTYKSRSSWLESDLGPVFFRMPLG